MIVIVLLKSVNVFFNLLGILFDSQMKILNSHEVILSNIIIYLSIYNLYLDINLGDFY